LEFELDRRRISTADEDRGLPRKWSGLMGELGRIAGESPGLNLPGEGELAVRAVEALSRGLAPDGTYVEPRYEDFRHTLHEAAVGAIFGLDAEQVGRVSGGEGPPTRAPLDPAEQRARYDRLYGAMPDSASRGELWNSYREFRGRLTAEQGGFGDFERIDISTFVLERQPETRIDGGLRVPNPLGQGAPPRGNFAVESKAGGSFNDEQSQRYSDNLASHDGTLVGDDGARYEGIVYLFDNVDKAAAVARTLDAKRRDGNMFVGYIDPHGHVQWKTRQFTGRATVTTK
jgi:hypothetical protein